MIGKILSIIAIIICLIVMIFFCTSCGTSRATARIINNADSTETHVSITTGKGGSTSVNVTPTFRLDSSRVNL